MEMLDKGIFEGIYTAVIPGIPAKYKTHKNVLKRGSDPDISINYYGVKSRQPLSEWKKKGWTTNLSPLGWWMWYVLYFEGRRNDKEDLLQIARWKSFIARHNAQVQSKCKKGDKSCNTKQRQGLLQWAWNSDTKFNDAQRKTNLKRLNGFSEITLENSHKSNYMNW
jgi:hypothetical protein